MLDLNLQLFADGESADVSADASAEVIGADSFDDAPAMEKDTRSFEEMYEFGRPEQTTGDEDFDEEAVEEEPEEIESPKEQPVEDFKNQHNAEMARMRREQETQQKIADAVKKAQDELIVKTFGGKINPYNNKPINTYEDYMDYERAYNEELLRESGITEEQMNNIIQQNPVVQQANQIVQESQERQQQDALARGQRQLTEEVIAISKLDPSVKTLDDIMAMDNFQAIHEKVNRGYSLLDAYKIENMDRLMQRKQAAAKQQVMNQSAGKGHLKATGHNGGGEDISIPTDIMAMYREMMPNASAKQIREHYKKHSKG